MSVDKMKSMGVKPLSRAEREKLRPSQYYEIDGVEVTAAEYREYSKEKAREAAEARVEEVGDAWGAEMDNRGIRFAGEFPKNKSSKVKLKCGCARAKTFESTIYQLARLERDKVCCTQCHEASKPDKLKEVIARKKGTLLTPYKAAHTPVKVRCYFEHEFSATPANLTRNNGKDGSWCPECYKRATGEPRFREILAERGYDLLSYGFTASDPYKIIVDADGVERSVNQARIVVNPPTYGGKHGKRPLRVFYDEDTGYAYALLDAVPPRLPKIIADIIAKNDFELITVAPNTPAAYDALREAISNENHHGDFHILNVYGNDDWQMPGVYKWGTIEPFDNTLVSTGEPE
ncbi:hypothetical protein vBRpoSV10_202 [Ruegeria phage vB_RpoS-V10]|nr:molybdopterin oxidoreductase Fe4S4 domain protein [Roseobacter phage DSS3P8]AWY09324.1 hypothetical protein vBRpoSV10_202 [Ruegeria phage vB_RpoS-V10]